MEKRKKRRRYTLRRQLLSLALGITIGLLAGLAHANSVQRHRQAIASLPSEPPVIATTQEAPETPTAPPEPYNDLNIPDNVEAAARAAGEAYGLPPELLEAVAFHESRYSLDAVNGDCIGLMQIATRWHEDRMERLGVTEADLWKAGPSMMVAADFLDELIRRYDDLGKALMYYNGGGDRMATYLERGELSWYASSVIEMAEQLRQEHGNAEEVRPLDSIK